jgi:hypothetical protein
MRFDPENFPFFTDSSVRRRRIAIAAGVSPWPTPTGDVRQGDASMTSTREERTRRLLFAAFLNVSLGLFSLATGINRPTIANMRTIDLVHLLATGACLGIGLVALLALVLNLVGRRRSKEKAADCGPEGVQRELNPL